METTTEAKNVTRYGNCGIDTCKLIDLLEAKAVGDVVTAEEMTDAIRKDVRPGGKGYGHLQSAITFMLNNRGALWRWQRGADCVKRLAAEERLDVARGTTRHIRRVSKRELKNLGSIDTKQLNGRTTEYGAELAALGSIALFADSNTRKKLEAREIKQPIDSKKLLEAFV